MYMNERTRDRASYMVLIELDMDETDLGPMGRYDVHCHHKAKEDTEQDA